MEEQELVQGQIPTMRVKIKDSGADAVINVADFKEHLHEKVETKRSPGRPKKEGGKEDAREGVDSRHQDPFLTPKKPNSAFTRDELAGMSTDAIKALPEASRIGDVASYPTKEKLIDAIIRARAS